MINHYSVLEYIEKKRGERLKGQTTMQRKAADVRKVSIEHYVKDKVDEKARERFKRKPYSVGGDAIGQKNTE